MKPLNEYISAVTTRVESIIRIVIDVDNEIELVYEFNDYDDIVTHQRPKLTMSTNSISQLEKSFNKISISSLLVMMINYTRFACN